MFSQFNSIKQSPGSQENPYQKELEEEIALVTQNNPKHTRLTLHLCHQPTTHLLGALYAGLKNNTHIHSLNLTMDLKDYDLFLSIWPSLIAAWPSITPDERLQRCDLDIYLNLNLGTRECATLSSQELECFKNILLKIGSENLTTLYLHEANNLWRLDFPILRELVETAKKNPFLNNILFWHSFPIEFKSLSDTWDYAKQLEFTRLYFSALSLAPNHSLWPLNLPLRITDHIAILSDFLDENPSSAWKIENLLNACPLFPDEDRSILQARFLSKMLASGCSTTRIDFTPEFSQNKILQQAYLQETFYTREIQINLDDPELDLAKIADFINKLNITHTGRLSLQNIDIETKGVDRILSFIQSIHHAKFSQLHLKAANLGQCPFERVIELIQGIRQTTKFTTLQLSNNGLNQWALDNFLTFIELTAEGEHFNCIDLSHNELWNLDLLSLETIKDKILSIPHWRNNCFALWDDELRVDIYQHWSREQQLGFLGIDLQTKRAWTTRDPLFAKEHCKVSSRDYLNLLKKYASDTSSDAETLALIKKCDLLPEHRLEYFLMALENSSDFLEAYGMYLFNAFNLEEVDELQFPIKPLLMAFKDTLEFEEIVEEGEAQEETLQTLILPKIREACKKLWPNNNFYHTSLQKLEAFQLNSPYDFLKLQNMTYWFLSTTLLIWAKTSEELKASSEMQEVLKAILEYQNPNGRHTLTKSYLNHILICEQGNKQFKSFTQNLSKNQKSFKQLLAVLITHIIMDNQNPEEQDELSRLGMNLLNHLPNEYKEAPTRNPLIGALEFLTPSPSISNIEKFQLIQSVLDLKTLNQDRKKRFKTQRQNWLLIQGLSQLNELRILRDAALGKEKISFNQAALQVVQNLFHLNKDEMEAYESTFFPLRNSTGVLTYLGKIRSVSDRETRKSLEKLYHQFIRSILSKNQERFYQLRYEESNSPHLEKLFSNRKMLKELWQENIKLDLKTFIEQHNIQDKPININYASFLKRILENYHLNPQHYPNLMHYLATEDFETRNTIRTELKGALGNFKPDHTLNDHMRRKFIEQDLISLIETDKNDKKTQLKYLNSVKRKLRMRGEESPEFLNDLAGVITHLKDEVSGRKIPNIEGWTIEFTDHFWDTFNCGTDVPGSCQRLDGDPELNKCVLAFCLDGKNKMFCIKDADGRIVTRCIGRLLFDEEWIILFREEIYPDVLPSILRQSLTLFSTLIAKYLDLSLHSMEASENSYPFPNPVCSLGSIANAEYVDAIHTVTDGEFSIPNSHVMLLREKDHDAGRVVLMRNALKTSFASVEQEQSEALLNIIGQYLAKTHPSVEEHEQGLQLTWMQARRSVLESVFQAAPSFEAGLPVQAGSESREREISDLVLAYSMPL